MYALSHTSTCVDSYERKFSHNALNRESLLFQFYIKNIQKKYL